MTDPDLRAEHYVLGLMEEAEAQAFEAAALGDPALAMALAQARDRFLPLDLSAPEVALPPGLVDRVRAAIDRPEPGPAPAAANLPRPPAGRWRIAAVAAGLGLLAGLGGARLAAPEPVVIAVLIDAAGEPQAVIEDFGNDRATLRFVADVVVPEGRTMQVWTLPAAAAGPVSLGTIDAVSRTRLDGAGLPSPVPRQLYEITIEPAGGSPTGRPTGPILGKGLAIAAGG